MSKFIRQADRLAPKITPQVVKLQHFHLPLLERLAFYYPLTKGLFLLILNISIATPFIIRFNFVWWSWVAFSPIILIVLFSIVEIIRWFYYKKRYNQWEFEQGQTSNHFDINEGPPGSCKSLHACFATYAMAKYSWRELQYEYWLLLPKLYENDAVLTEDEKEIVDAYKFFANSQGIPCLASNIPIWSKELKRFSYEIGVESLKQKTRLPYRTNGMVDELSTICPPDLYLDRKKNIFGSADISDFGKFCRQFGEFRFIGCEQDGNNYYIDLRRVNSQIRTFDGKTNVLEPRFLRWVFEKLKTRAINHMSFYKARIWAKFLNNFEKFIESVGFFKIKYHNTKRQAIGVSGQFVVVKENDDPQETIYFPRAMPFKYETRAYRNAYKPLKDPILLKPFEKLRMTREKGLSMLRSNNLVDVKE